MRLVVVGLVGGLVGSRKNYLRFQRGDQGPDREGGRGGLAGVSPGGPNVCRTRGTSQCCPGWQVRQPAIKGMVQQYGTRLSFEEDLNVFFPKLFVNQTLVHFVIYFFGLI